MQENKLPKEFKYFLKKRRPKEKFKNPKKIASVKITFANDV